MLQLVELELVELELVELELVEPGGKREILASAAVGQGQDGLRRGGRSVRNVDLSSLQR